MTKNTHIKHTKNQKYNQGSQSSKSTSTTTGNKNMKYKNTKWVGAKDTCASCVSKK